MASIVLLTAFGIIYYQHHKHEKAAQLKASAQLVDGDNVHAAPKTLPAYEAAAATNLPAYQASSAALPPAYQPADDKAALAATLSMNADTPSNIKTKRRSMKTKFMQSSIFA